MKKTVMLIMLAVILSVGAFAEHPSGWGVGVVGQGGVVWDGFGGSGGGALSLKAPQFPIYWGISFALRNNFWGISVTGDYFTIENTINSNLNLGWFFGIGGYAGVYGYSGSESGIALHAGARAPIGIYIFPLNFLEVFLDVAPSLGLGLGIGDRGGINIDGGIGGELGVRFWF